MKPDRPLLLYAVLLLIHLLFFLVVLLGKPVPLSDSKDYLNASRNLYQQGTLYCGDLNDPIREVQYTRRPPLYPLFVGIELLSGSRIPLILLQIIISLISIGVVMRIFNPMGQQSKSFNGSMDQKPVNSKAQAPDISSQMKWYRVIFLLFLVATPAQFIYASRVMAEILLQLMIVLATWSLYTFLRNDRALHIWLFHLFFTMGMATKPVLFPFMALILPLSFLLFFRSKKRAFLVALLLPLIWIIGYSYRNYRVTGSAQYSSIQTANLINYNLRYFVMGREGSITASEKVDNLYARCKNKTSYREENHCLLLGVREVILDQPVSYSLFHLMGGLRLFIDPGRFDIVKFFGIQESDTPGFLKELNQNGLSGAFRYLREQGMGLVLILGLIVLFKLLKISGFLIYMIRYRGDIIFKVFLVVLLLYMAVVTGPLGASRFLLPVELLLIGGAVKGWGPLLTQTGLHSKRIVI